MTVLMQMDLPLKREDVEAVAAEVESVKNPPDGLLVHVMTETANGVHIVDVWESQAQFEKFRDDRLMPSMMKVMTKRGIPMDGPPPEPTFDEAFDVVRGR